MRIAHVTAGLCRQSAGLGTAVAALSAASERAGNQVRVFGISSKNWVERDSQIWRGAPAMVFEPSRWSGSFGYASRMLTAIKTFNPDIIHVHGLWTYASMAAHGWSAKTGRPYVVSAHGMLMPESLRYGSLKKRIARCVFQNNVLRGAAVLHATSDDEMKAYQSLGFNNRKELIPIGMEIQPVPAIDTPDNSTRVALFLGRIHHQKGIDWLVEAWTKLENDFPDWRLSIVGPVDPKYARHLERLKTAGEMRRISFESPVYGDDKYRCMVSADLFLMPSRSENFGLTAAESLMMSVPVIATKGTPWSGLVSADAGWWVEPNIKALEMAMREAMTFPKSRLQKMGANGRFWIIRDFSFSSTVKNMNDMYQSLSRK